MVSLPDLVLMHEVDARRALAGRALSFAVLAPVGAFAGRGVLRVLRARAISEGGTVELVCGYESYERIDA
ncbi:MAG: hypothetical protein M3Y18_08435 [Candidatus Eremiobacteraeota bacterium]|nr:hypothetical protein [Candidatus Eremiobacteraeota bacterium]